jgi:hypothetical protein
MQDQYELLRRAMSEALEQRVSIEGITSSDITPVRFLVDAGYQENGDVYTMGEALRSMSDDERRNSLEHSTAKYGYNSTRESTSRQEKGECHPEILEMRERIRQLRESGVSFMKCPFCEPSDVRK